jgi:MoaA/NifB/PqqE/SkfB family radical SAM enzyme
MHRWVRRGAMKIIEWKIYHDYAVRNPENRPVRVQKDKVSFLSAMMHSVDRALSRGLISKHVVNRILESLVDNIVCSETLAQKYASKLSYPPMFITISPGKRCNLQCAGCYACSDSKAAEKLDFTTFDRILTEKEKLWNSFFTVISGGEPFLWEGDGHDIVDMAARHPGQFFLIYTNGTLIDEKMARRLEEAGNITPAISVEGYEAETDGRRGKGIFKRILKAFDTLRNAGVPFGVSTTATRHNWDVVTNDKFADFFFDEQGAVYQWLFQYMPIGRKHTLDLMVTPEQRFEMLKRMYHMVRERKLLIADFWNSGVASDGCLAAGRPGGYFYITWDGDVTPCVFVPYAAANINDIYKNGGDLNTILETPLFCHVREWQNNYGYTRKGHDIGNWLMPCAIRDHFADFHKGIENGDAKPIDSEAAAAMTDKDYYAGMVKYGHDYEKLCGRMWHDEFLATCHDEKEQVAKTA